MSDPDLDGIWELTIALAPGNYEFKYAYDSWAGQESLTEGLPCTVTNNGFTNRSLNVGNQNLTLGTVCWASCDDCGVEPVTYDVHFSLDMTEVADPFTTPEVNGTFNGWCGGCAPMSDVNMDGIWELTIALAPGNYEFKYAYDAWTGQETLMEGMPCTVTNNGFTNRSLVVQNQNIDLNTVCWGSCVDCASQPNTYDVHFAVAMNEVAEPFTTPEVNGNFNGWCGGCAPMSDADADGIWELTIALAPGTYEFKYAYDTWAGQETLTPGLPCTITTDIFTNRVFTVTDAEIDLGEVCWASCNPCEQTPEVYDVTFFVDMNDYTEPFTTPEVNGTFNNWCGNCAPMSDVDGNNIWEITIPLAAGTYEYKFSYDNWAGQEEFIGGESCTVTTDGFTNRLLVVDQDTSLSEVCFNDCAACPTSINENEMIGLTLYPNPVSGDVVTIQMNNSSLGVVQIAVVDAIGKTVALHNFNFNGGLINLPVDVLSPGLYHLTLSIGNEKAQKSFIIE
jgi:1,4-alpha-glucan branching enzyme